MQFQTKKGRKRNCGETVANLIKQTRHFHFQLHLSCDVDMLQKMFAVFICVCPFDVLIWDLLCLILLFPLSFVSNATLQPLETPAHRKIHKWFLVKMRRFRACFVHEAKQNKSQLSSEPPRRTIPFDVDTEQIEGQPLRLGRSC